MDQSKLNIERKNSSDAWNEVYKLISWWDVDKISDATIMVVGAGALGNEVLKNLALLNVGNILIVDFDTIEYSNLSRSVLFRESDADAHRLKAEVAAERVKTINPHVKVMMIQGDIGIDVGLGVYRRMDAVIGCLDNRLARLYINRNCFRVNKTWVDGAIENLAGQLNVYRPGKSCYECQLTDFEWENIRYKMGCPDVAQRNKSMGRIPTTPISASVIGALQVQEALKVIYNNSEQSLAGQTFQFEGMNNMFLLHDSGALKEECASHYGIESMIEAHDLSNQSSIGQVFEWCKKHFRTEQISLQLDHEIALEISSDKTEKVHSLMRAKPHLSDQFLLQFQEFPDEGFIITKSLSTIDNSFIGTEINLSELGIPPLHIIQIETEEDIFFVELSGDRDYLIFK